MSKGMRLKGRHDGEAHGAGRKVKERAHLNLTPAYRKGFEEGLIRSIHQEKAATSIFKTWRSGKRKKR